MELPKANLVAVVGFEPTMISRERMKLLPVLTGGTAIVQVLYQKSDSCLATNSLIGL
jgi:hypothetical protein